MAGLSIIRRRKAWLKGVAFGATGKGKCLLRVQKLREIFQRGVTHAQAHAATPYVKAVAEQEARRRGGRGMRTGLDRPRRPGGPSRR
jgi:hypothetical protein